MASEDSGIRAVGYCCFCLHWRRLIPHVTVMKPMTDLCWECQQHSVTIMRASNLPLEQKSEVSSSNFTTQNLTRFVIGGEESGRTLGNCYKGPELLSQPDRWFCTRNQVDFWLLSTTSSKLSSSMHEPARASPEF